MENATNGKTPPVEPAKMQELLPEAITLDEWGYPVLRSTEVPPELLAHARRAVAGCPVLALRLDRPSANRT